MRQGIALVLWTWLAISLGVYGYRLWRRVSQGPEGAREARAAQPTDTTGAASAIATGPTTARPTYDPGLARMAERDAVTRDTTDTTDTTDTSESVRPPAAGGGRAGLFAPAPSPASAAPKGSEPTGAAGRVVVAAALRGIEMPCGLAPLMGTDTGVDPHRVAFFTDGAPAATVGARLGDELERLGFALRSTSEVEVLAERDGVQVSVVLHPDAATEKLGTERRYPTVPPGSVVVELST